MTFVWSRNKVTENSHISFFCGRDPFFEVVGRPENTYGGADRFAWVISGFLPSVQNYRPYIVFQVLWTRLFAHVFSVYDWLSELTYFPFFSVICWSYLRTEISVILSTGNKLDSRHHPLLPLSCEATLLMLSCDRIESAKFFHSTPSLAKLVYYSFFSEDFSIKKYLFKS